MIDNFDTDTILENFTIDELESILKAAKERKEKLEAKKRREAAENLVEAFLTYKAATGKDTIKLYGCSGWSKGPSKTDVIININDLFVDDNGNVCHKLIY